MDSDLGEIKQYNLVGGESKAFDRSNATQPTLRLESRYWCQSFAAARKAT